jgi:hypothetical protein
MRGLRAEKIFERVVTGVLGRGQSEGRCGWGRRSQREMRMGSPLLLLLLQWFWRGER